MERTNLAPTFTDLALAGLGGPQATAFFARCQELIPFATLAASVANIFVEDSPRAGRPTGRSR